MTRLVLVRHGESLATVEQVVGGIEGCKGLSDHGRAQAAALRDRLARTRELAGAAALYTSVLPRAIETAEILAPALGALEPVQRCELCEIHPGEADGLTWDEFKRRYSPAEDRFVRDPFRRWAPGAESWAEFAARVGTELTRLAREHRGETVVLAVHGGVVEASMLTFGGLSLTHQLNFDVTNTSLTEWWQERDDVWSLRRYNDAAHLAGLEP